MRKLSVVVAVVVLANAALAEDNPGPQSYRSIYPYSFMGNPNPWADNKVPIYFLHPYTPTITSGGCGAVANGSVAGVDGAGKITIGSATTATCQITFGDPNWTPKACTFSPASSGAATVIATVYISVIAQGSFTLAATALASTSWEYDCK